MFLWWCHVMWMRMSVVLVRLGASTVITPQTATARPATACIKGVPVGEGRRQTHGTTGVGPSIMVSPNHGRHATAFHRFSGPFLLPIKVQAQTKCHHSTQYGQDESECTPSGPFFVQCQLRQGSRFDAPHGSRQLVWIGIKDEHEVGYVFPSVGRQVLHGKGGKKQVVDVSHQRTNTPLCKLVENAIVANEPEIRIATDIASFPNGGSSAVVIGLHGQVDC